MAKTNFKKSVKQLLTEVEAEIHDLGQKLGAASEKRNGLLQAIGETPHAIANEAVRGRGVLVGGRRKTTGRKGRKSGGKRLDWNSLLTQLPKQFKPTDVVKLKELRGKGLGQVYPALRRWQDQKLVRRLKDGSYEVTAAGSKPAKAEKNSAPRKAKRATAKRTKTTKAKRSAPKAPKAKKTEKVEKASSSRGKMLRSPAKRERQKADTPRVRTKAVKKAAAKTEPQTEAAAAAE